VGSERSEAVGLIPAAGLGTRLLPLAYPKELLPITYTEADGRVVPRPVLQASLEQMRRADVRRCTVVIAEWKLELVRVFGDGAALGIDLAYVVRGVPRGLSDALAAALPWLGDADACLALPDTLIAPEDALARVREERARSGADVVLGVFPTDHPEELGPVRVDASGAVVEVLDKPAATDLRNTWGLATWSPRFSALLAREVAAAPEREKPVLGALFQRALEAGLAVRAVVFESGRFVDVGTSRGLAEALAQGALRR
jgi:glucose-1-phosphate thymidylyltransferase